MTYLEKKRLDRRNMIMKAVRKELKAHNAYVAPESLRMLANTLDVSNFYQIEVIRTVDEAAKKLQLANEEFEHSWNGSYSTEEEGTTVFGVVTFGEHYHYQYSDNGNITKDTEYCTDADFNLNEAFGAIIRRREYDDYGREDSIHRILHTIVIYTPEQIVDEQVYVSEKNAELNTICDLRN